MDPLNISSHKRGERENEVVTSVCMLWKPRNLFLREKWGGWMEGWRERRIKWINMRWLKWCNLFEQVNEQKEGRNMLLLIMLTHSHNNWTENATHTLSTGKRMKYLFSTLLVGEKYFNELLLFGAPMIRIVTVLEPKGVADELHLMFPSLTWKLQAAKLGGLKVWTCH